MANQINDTELRLHLKPWILELVQSGAGSVVTGSGTSGRIAEWNGAYSLTNSTLAKTGAGLLTLSAAGAASLAVTGTSDIAGSLTGAGTIATGGFTGTLPATGTLALQTALVAGQVAYAGNANTITSSARVTYTLGVPNTIAYHGEDGFNALLSVYTHDNGGANRTTSFVGYNDSGTMAIPAATINGATLFELSGRGHDGVAYTSQRAVMRFITTEAWTNTANGTAIAFLTTPNGSVTRAEVARISQAGRLGLGTNSPQRLAHVSASDAVTNTVTYTNRLEHITSGTAAAGFGVGSEWYGENSTGTSLLMAADRVTFPTVGASWLAARYFDIMDSAGTRTPLALFANGTQGYAQLGDWVQMAEVTAPAAPAANNGVFYVVDDGAGVTQLRALFATGDPLVLGLQGITVQTYTQTYSTASRTVNPTATAAFTGIDNLQIGTPYAQLTDLNTLRTDMLAAVQNINALIDDLQARVIVK